MKKAILKLTNELVNEALGLPADTVISAVKQEFGTGHILLRLSHPALDDIPEGGDLPFITPSELAEKMRK